MVDAWDELERQEPPVPKWPPRVKRGRAFNLCSGLVLIVFALLASWFVGPNRHVVWINVCFAVVLAVIWIRAIHQKKW